MYEDLMVTLLFLEVAGTELAWKKTYGGLEYDWIGYWQDLRYFIRVQLGIGGLHWNHIFRSPALAEFSALTKMAAFLGGCHRTCALGAVVFADAAWYVAPRVEAT